MAQASPDVLSALEAYKNGLFAMAESRESGRYQWYEAPLRGVLPLDCFHIPRRLRRLVRQAPFEIRIDSAFARTLAGCAAAAPDRPDSWINPGISDLFLAFHGLGIAHSVEAWRDGELVGGLYGWAVGGVFSAESMFSRASGASKVALVHLAARLWRGGFALFDAQLVNPHLKQFGIREVTAGAYRRALDAALKMPADFRLREFSEAQLLAEYLSFLAPAR